MTPTNEIWEVVVRSWQLTALGQHDLGDRLAEFFRASNNQREIGRLSCPLQAVPTFLDGVPLRIAKSIRSFKHGRSFTSGVRFRLAMAG